MPKATPIKNVQDYDHWQIVIPISAEEVEDMPKSVNRIMLARDLKAYGWPRWHVARIIGIAGTPNARLIYLLIEIRPNDPR